MLLNCTNGGDYTSEVQIMFLEVIMAFQIHESGRDHTITVTFDRPIQGKFEGIYTANNRLAIMERSVYVFALPDD